MQDYVDTWHPFTPRCQWLFLVQNFRVFYTVSSVIPAGKRKSLLPGKSVKYCYCATTYLHWIFRFVGLSVGRVRCISILRSKGKLCMNYIERFAELLSHGKVEEWSNQIFRLGRDLGYEQTRLAILPNSNAPIEAEHAFQHSNYSSCWLSKYTENKMHHFDPTFAHCISKSIFQIWSPEIFESEKQKEMYEEACGYGIRSGVTLPIHGARGELGIVCFVSDAKPSKHFQLEAAQRIPELSCLRDFIFESSLQFIMRSCTTSERIHITRRELECLKWSAVGKSSWEIGHLLNCSEATVNFHFSNIRRKFNANTRQQAIVRAIGIGLIDPA